MSGPQTETTLCVCRSHGGLVYRRAGWQSAEVFVVLAQPTCIDQWTRRPLAETSIDPCRSREPAKALRAERAGLERNKPLRYSAAGAPTHVGANGVKPEQLSPPEISRRLSPGGAVIKDERLQSSVGAEYVLKKYSPCTIPVRRTRRKRGGLGERGAGASRPRHRRASEIIRSLMYA